MKRGFMAVLLAAFLCISGCTGQSGEDQVQGIPEPESQGETGALPGVREPLFLRGVYPQWMPGGGGVSCYRDLEIVHLDDKGLEVDAVPVDALFDEGTSAFLYAISLDGEKILTSAGILDRQGNVVAVDFPPSEGRKEKGLVLEELGWLDNDTAYAVDQWGISAYTVSTGAYNVLTPDPASVFTGAEYDVYLHMSVPQPGGMLQYGNRLFYRGLRDIVSGVIRDDIYTCTPEGETLLVPQQGEDYAVNMPVYADGQYLWYSGDNLQTLSILDYDNNEEMGQYPLEDDCLFYDSFFQDGKLYVAFGYYSEGAEFAVASYDLEGQRDRSVVYGPQSTPLNLEFDPEGQVVSFRLVAAGEGAVYYSFDYSEVKDNASLWNSALVRFDRGSGESEVVLTMDLDRRGAIGTAKYLVSPDGRGVIAYCDTFFIEEEEFYVLPLELD